MKPIVAALIISLLGGLVAVTQGCGTRANLSSGAIGNGPTPNPTPSGTPGPSPTPGGAQGGTPSNFPFEVMITSQYEQGGATTTEADCQMPVGSPTGTTIACTNSVGSVNNTVAIPEARLFFSKVSFTVSVGSAAIANGCELAVFQPFYYVASTSAAFSPPWNSGSALVCNPAAPTQPPVGCFGGPAIDIVTSFPSLRAMYFAVPYTYSTTYTANSANSHTWGSNRFMVNDLVTRNGAPHTWKNGDAYIGTSNSNYVDYNFSCRDHWYQLVYGFTLTLTDVDLNGTYPNTSQGVPNINNFPDWDLLSWDY